MLFAISKQQPVVSMGRMLFRATNLSIDTMGTSAVALVGGLLIFALVLWRKWKREGRDSVLKDWRGELGLVVALTVAWWAIVFGFAVTRTIWKDHNELVDQNRKVREALKNAKIPQPSPQPVSPTQNQPAHTNESPCS